MKRRIRTPWQKILDASEAGRSLRLSVDEVDQLMSDGAIATRASLDRELWGECPNHRGNMEGELCPWCGAGEPS